MDTMTSFSLWGRDTAERALSTLIQAAIVFVLSAQAGQSEGTLKALASAVFPAVATVLLNAITVFVPVVKNYYLDVAIRITRTFLTTTLGALVADVKFNYFELTGWKTLFILGGSAVLVVIKSELAKMVSNTITPASLAKAS